MVFTFFDKSTTNTGTEINYDLDSENQQLAEELLEKLKKHKIYSFADLADMQLISKYSREIRFFLMCY